MHHDTYPNYASLAAAQVEGRDFQVIVQARPEAKAAIVAPHAGKIESRTSDIAAAIAGEDQSLYLFEGLMDDHNWDILHITSHKFDEPRCLDLLRTHESVLSIHGCGNINATPNAIYVGGLDERGKQRVADALRAAGFDARTTNHQFAGTEPNNVCNRGTTGKGIQLEISRALRNAMDIQRFSAAVRAALQL